MKKIQILLFALVALAMSFTVNAQDAYRFKNAVVTSAYTDTVTNAGTAYLVSPSLSVKGATSTTVEVYVDKVSGTVGGTITLLGSVDGTNFVTVKTVGTQTAITAITATDADAAYHWIILGSPFPYYRVSYTGTGTMVAIFQARIYRAFN
jgi:hypothetical protein